jgi:8-oxo-dGTP diphosphatase
MDIETSRLRLRCYGDSDLSDLVTLIGNWDVARWLSRLPYPYTETHGREWIASVQHEHATGCARRFAVALKGDNRLIGGCGLDGEMLDGVTDEPVLGYWLGQPYWGNGYGCEAVAALVDYTFRTFAAEAISAYTDPANIASQKVLLKCGLERTGEIDLVRPTRNGASRVPLFRTPPAALRSP